MKYAGIMIFTYKDSSKEDFQITYEEVDESDYKVPRYEINEKISNDKIDNNFNCWARYINIDQEMIDHFEWPETVQEGFEMFLTFNSNHPVYNALVLGDFQLNNPFPSNVSMEIPLKFHTASKDVIYYFIKDRFNSKLKMFN